MLVIGFPFLPTIFQVVSSAASYLTAWGLDLAAMPAHPDPRVPKHRWPDTDADKERVWVDAVVESFHKSAGYAHLPWAQADLVLDAAPIAPTCVSTTANQTGLAAAPRRRGNAR